MIREKSMVLITPPVCTSLTPQLASPVLAGFVRQHGGRISQRDLNIEFYGYLRSKVTLHEDPGTEFDSQRRRVIQDALICFFLKDYFHQARDTNHYYSEALFQSDPNMEAISFNINNGFGLGLRELAFTDLPMIKRYVLDQENNFYHQFYRTIDESSLATSFDYVGFSLSSVDQLIPALTLCHRLKVINPRIKIVLGGVWVTLFAKDLSQAKELFEFYDYIVSGEGEKAILELLKHPDQDHFPNTYLKTSDGFATPRSYSYVRMDELPPPDYSDFDLSRYDTPDWIWLQSARGCYWGKCAFCVHVVGTDRFKMKSLEGIKAEILSIREKYKPAVISFADVAIPPKKLLKLAEWMIENNLQQKWSALLRFEKDLTCEMLETYAKSGLILTSFGLESGTDKILTLVNKGHDRKDVRRILESCKRLQIYTIITSMLGLPQETESDAQATLSFLEELKDLMSESIVLVYRLESGTPIHQNPGRYGIQYDPKDQKLFDTQVKFTNLKGISSARAYELVVGYYRNQHSSRPSELLDYIPPLPRNTLLGNMDEIPGFRATGHFEFFQGLPYRKTVQIRRTRPNSLEICEETRTSVGARLPEERTTAPRITDESLL